MKYISNFRKFNESEDRMVEYDKYLSEMLKYEEYAKTYLGLELKDKKSDVTEGFLQLEYVFNTTVETQFGMGLLVKIANDNIDIYLIGKAPNEIYLGQFMKNELINDYPLIKLAKESSVNYSIHLYVGNFVRTATKFDLFENGLDLVEVFNKIGKYREKWFKELPYFVKYSSKEDLIKWWVSIDTDNAYRIFNILKKANDGGGQRLRINRGLSDGMFYVAESSYSSWVKTGKVLLVDVPAIFITNLHNKTDVKTSRPDHQYHGFVICSKENIKQCVEIMKQHTDIFDILSNPINCDGGTSVMPLPVKRLDYIGCFDRFVSVLNIDPNMQDSAGKMGEMGF